MLKKIQEKFGNGIEKIKWVSSVLSERIKVEIAVVRLIFQADRMKKKKEELLIAIGQRVLELKGHSEMNIMKDDVIVESVTEIEKLENSIDDMKQKASEISRVAD